MENMVNAERNNCPIAANQSQIHIPELQAQQRTAITVGRQVRTRTVEAVRDTFHSGVAVGQIAAIASAAGVVAVSNGIASSARAVAKQCDSWSAGLKGWILSR